MLVQARQGLKHFSRQCGKAGTDRESDPREADPSDAGVLRLASQAHRIAQMTEPSPTTELPQRSQLVAQAREALRHAHAPYSRFAVGAAVLDDRGRVFAGANVENASYGLSMCAERVAIFSAIASGARRIVAIAVAAERAEGITPCGACRQVIAEFCGPEAPVFSDGGSDAIREWRLGDLLPHAFGASALIGRPPRTR